MELIAKGYATKSMDVHDKSSNWGLTAGMVPVDPRFSKEKKGQPIRQENQLKKSSGAAQSIPLRLEEEVLMLFTSKNKVRQQYSQTCPCPCGNSMTEFEHYQADGDHDFCFLRRKETKEVLWCYRFPRGGQEQVPIYVWAYKVGGKWTPVTGDYDMWLVAPHLTTCGDLDIKSVVDTHGRSAASEFTQELIRELNVACNRGDNHVFHHGAEAQNFSFTQKLPMDKPLPVFCPGEHYPFMIEPERLPHLVFNILSHGYLATINPKWRNGVTLGIEDTAYALDQRVGRNRAREIRNQSGSSVAGSDALAQVETSMVVALQRRWREIRRARSEQADLSKRDRHVKEDVIAQLKKVRIDNAVKRLKADVNRQSMTVDEAVNRLNNEFFEGANRGMALRLYNGFKWSDRVNELAIFRRIADATGIEASRGEDLPAECFKPDLGDHGANARLLARMQEDTFGRSRFEEEHGHYIPIDETDSERLRKFE